MRHFPAVPIRKPNYVNYLIGTMSYFLKRSFSNSKLDAVLHSVRNIGLVWLPHENQYALQSLSFPLHFHLFISPVDCGFLLPILSKYFCHHFFLPTFSWAILFLDFLFFQEYASIKILLMSAILYNYVSVKLWCIKNKIKNITILCADLFS